MNNNSKVSDFNKIILKVIKEDNPQSVEELARLLKRSLDLPQEAIIEFILKLQAEKKIRLQNQTRQSRNFANYLKTGGAIWYWLTIATGSITSIMSFMISESMYPWIYGRNLLSLVFIFFLPGFAFTKSLLLGKTSRKKSIGSLETIQLITLSIGMSIALVSLIGLLLYYSPWGLNFVTIVPSLFTFTSVFATAGVIREYILNAAEARR